MSRPTPRRSLAVAVAAAVSLAGLAACGTGSEADDAPSGDARSVDGVYGEVEVTGTPERVVALTAQVADILVGLGIQPVAIGVADADIEYYPWLEDAFTGEIDDEMVAGFVADPEVVASYDPDLIVGSSWIVPEDVYGQLGDIAPTFVGLSDGNDDWDALTLAIGELTDTDGQTVVDGVESACTAGRGDLTALAGSTYQYVAAEEGQFRYGNGSWLECFGLTPAANQDNTQQTEAGVSAERVGDLDADVLAIFDRIGVRETLAADPRFTALPSMTDGAVVWLDFALANATNSPGPLAFTYVIEQVQPVLAAAVAQG